MKALVAFLSLRPLVTRRTLLLIWYGYLLLTLLQVANWIYWIGSPMLKMPQYEVALAPFLSLIFYLVHLALVRVFLELASKLMNAPTETAES